MKVKRRVRWLRFVTFFSLLLVFSILAGSFSEADAQSDVWVSAYYAGWMQGCGYGKHLPADQIDFDALTHVLHFSIMPNRDGSIEIC